MATIISGISRLFQPTIGILSAEKICQGANPWYFLIGLRMVTLFFSYGPWESLNNDLVCRWASDVGDAKTFCSALCYNQRFPIPISGLWVFYFIAIIFTVALLKFVYYIPPETSPKAKDVEAAPVPKTPEESKSSEVASTQPQFGSWRYGIYIFCICFILSLEVTFTWTLLGLQLPIMTEEITICEPSNTACPPSAQCALNGLPDKLAIVWMLAFSSVANACVCIGYLATHCCQACGLCRGSEGAKPGVEMVGRGCRCHGTGCQGNCGGWTEGQGSVREGKPGGAGCRCQSEGANRCCRQGNEGGRDEGSEAGQSSLTSREDSEGKLLRGDTEMLGEKKEWGTGRAEKWIPMREPLRIADSKGRGSPRGCRTVKNGAKYQPWRNRRL